MAQRSGNDMAGRGSGPHHTAIASKPASITVSRDGQKWFVSIQTERAVKQPVHPSSSIVGIDLGVVRFATLSNGEVIPPARSLEKKEKRLKRYQRRMARRVKFSNNWANGAGNWNISRTGSVDGCFRFRHRTRAASVQAVDTPARKTVPHRQSFCVCNAVIPKTRI
jgi:hypothetical protein